MIDLLDRRTAENSEQIARLRHMQHALDVLAEPARGLDPAPKAVCHVVVDPAEVDRGSSA